MPKTEQETMRDIDVLALEASTDIDKHLREYYNPQYIVVPTHLHNFINFRIKRALLKRSLEINQEVINEIKARI